MITMFLRDLVSDHGTCPYVEQSPCRLVCVPCATQPRLLRAGEMNDAAEVLRMLYDALIQQGHRDMVTACFGLDIHESVRCRHCDMETHALRYTQYFQVRRRPCTSSLRPTNVPYGPVMGSSQGTATIYDWGGATFFCIMI